MLSSLKKKICPQFSIEAVQDIFKATSEIEGEENKVDFFFKQFELLDSDTVIELWDCYLNEAMQTAYSSGIDSAIGFNRWTGYDTELADLY